MMRLIPFLAVLTLPIGAMPVVGQQPGAQQPAAKAPSQLPSVTLPPELDRVLRDYEAAWRRGDGAALATLFAEDGFVLQNGKPPVRGRSAIQAAYQGSSGGPLKLRALSAATADTIGFIVGAYGYGADAADTGKFTLTLKRVRGGRWLIFSDIDNENSAPRRAAGS